MHDTGEVDQLASQIDARVDGLSQPMLACTALSPEDLAAWKSFYFSWKTLSIYWTNLRANSGIINSVQGLFDTEGLIGASIYDQMTPYNAQLPKWVAKLKAACPSTSYTAPPDIVVPTPQKETDWAGIAQKAMIAAIALGSAAVLYKGLTIVEDFTSHARK